MPFLAKHVQLRQVKTSHAEVLAQDAESEQQRRVSMKIELHHFTPVLLRFQVSSIMDDDDDHHHIPQGELRARDCVNPHVLGARLSPHLGTGMTDVLHAVHFLVHA
jgi:hypothetical protein